MLAVPPFVSGSAASPGWLFLLRPSGSGRVLGSPPGPEGGRQAAVVSIDNDRPVTRALLG